MKNAAIGCASYDVRLRDYTGGAERAMPKTGIHKKAANEIDALKESQRRSMAPDEKKKCVSVVLLKASAE